jgi:hypothetical protein
MSYTEGCLVCGKELEYTQDAIEKICYFCGNGTLSNVQCPDDHFICDTCHGSSANDLIEIYCVNTTSDNPFEIALELMQNQKINMHGPEHHYLVPAVLIAAYVNKHKQSNINKPAALRTAKLRASKVPGGFCGTHGNCGAAVGAGIFMSVITRSSPLAVKEWQLSNKLTGKALLAVAEKGGPRCCKRDTFIVLEVVNNFLEEEFNTKLPATKVSCNFSSRNRQCTYEFCDYYPVNQ